MDALVLRHDCLKWTEMHIFIYCQRQRCSQRSVVSGDMSYADIRSGSLMRWCQITSAVVENASFLFRSLGLYLPYEVPHWLYISKFTRLRMVSWRQHGSCFMY